jgi:hypothetical protein
MEQNVEVQMKQLDLPPRFRFFPNNGAPHRDWRKMCGMFNTDGHDVDRFLEQKQADKLLEYEIEERRMRERKTLTI